MRDMKKALIDPDEQAVIVVIRPDGDPGVLINPRFGWKTADAVSVIRAIADRLERDDSAGTPSGGASIVQSPSGS